MIIVAPSLDVLVFVLKYFIKKIRFTLSRYSNQWEPSVKTLCFDFSPIFSKHCMLIGGPQRRGFRLGQSDKIKILINNDLFLFYYLKYTVVFYPLSSSVQRRALSCQSEDMKTSFSKPYKNIYVAWFKSVFHLTWISNNTLKMSRNYNN